MIPATNAAHALVPLPATAQVQPANQALTPGRDAPAPGRLTRLKGMLRRTAPTAAPRTVPGLQQLNAARGPEVQEYVNSARSRLRFAVFGAVMSAIGAVGLLALTPISVGASAVPAGAACVAFAVTLGDCVLAYRDYRNAQAIAANRVPPYKLEAGTSSIGHVLHKAFRACGVPPERARRAAAIGDVILRLGILIGGIATLSAVGTTAAGVMNWTNTSLYSSYPFVSSVHNYGSWRLTRSNDQIISAANQIVAEFEHTQEMIKRSDEQLQTVLPPDVRNLALSYLDGPEDGPGEAEVQAYDAFVAALAQKPQSVAEDAGHVDGTAVDGPVVFHLGSACAATLQLLKFDDSNASA